MNFESNFSRVYFILKLIAIVVRFLLFLIIIGAVILGLLAIRNRKFELALSFIIISLAIAFIVKLLSGILELFAVLITLALLSLLALLKK